jgi:GT2 family glycosyltransferase
MANTWFKLGRIEAAIDKIMPERVVKNMLKSLFSPEANRSYIKSGYFDPHWYLMKNPDVKGGAKTALNHYLKFGWREKRDPSPLFSVTHYLALNTDVVNNGLEPLEHYLTFGAKEHRSPNPAFDAVWYTEKYIKPSGFKCPDPFRHFLSNGGQCGYWPHPLFDPAWYARSACLDARATATQALLHYLSSDGRGSPNQFFDGSYYIDANRDVSISGLHPLTHFHYFGSREGRKPSEQFDTGFYLSTYQDVAKADINPLVHFLHYGWQEGRSSKISNSEKSDVAESYVSVLKARLDQFKSDKSWLRFSEVSKPKVSIIIVLFNKAYFTLRCLESLLYVDKSGDDPLFEVVIYDNGSTDETVHLLNRIENVTIVRNNENVGFLRAVNEAARHVHGDQILLLNNDTEVFRGSIKAALLSLLRSPDIGAVGGRLVFPSGAIQEAGSIVFKDGSCLGYGRGLHAYDGRVMFRRYVDYCSGAFLLFNTKIFRKLGGLDEAYAPAYYEETDFCARLASIGLRVLYEPNALVLHYEFGSSSGKSQALFLQRKNRAIFQSKQVKFVREKLEQNNKNIIEARIPNCERSKRILIIDDKVPHAWLGAGFPRAATILSVIHSIFGSNGLVTLLVTDDKNCDWAEIRDSVAADIEVLFLKKKEEFEEIMIERQNYYGAIWVSRPHNIIRINELVDRGLIDLSQSSLIYDAEALFSLRECKKAELNGKLITEEDVRNAVASEVSIGRNAQFILTVSDHEAQYFRNNSRATVKVLGHSLIPKRKSPGPKGRRDFLFVGAIQGPESPNGDSLKWFIQEVWPIVTQAEPEVYLDIVGQLHWDELKNLAPPSVRFLGRVDKLELLYDQHKVFIAPTRFSAGIPHKVHEAAAAGLPCVASNLIAGQLGWNNRSELLSASTKEEYAIACVELLRDAELWISISNRANDAVYRDCNPKYFNDTIYSTLVNLNERQTCV